MPEGKLPDKIGKYKIVEAIGRGSMGIIYKGVDPFIERYVAIKTIRFDSSLFRTERKNAIKRLLLEAKAVGKLSHPNIVTIYEAGEDNGLYYIAMEYLDGRELSKYLATLKDQPLEIKFACKIAVHICQGLDFAHKYKIIHRDIKPGNIMILRSGDAKVMDFGIAMLADSNLSLTHSGKTLGSPSYMSPEQIMGSKLDHRTDIFSTGIVFYEMLTLKKPFQGKNIGEVAYKITTEEPIPPSEYNPNIPPELDAVILKALEKNPRDRFQTCKAFADAIQNAFRIYLSKRKKPIKDKKLDKIKKKKVVVNKISDKIYEASNFKVDTANKIKHILFISLLFTLILTVIKTPMFINNYNKQKQKREISALIKQGEDFFNSGNINEAILTFNNVLKKDSTNTKVLIYLAKGYKEQGKDEKSIYIYHKLIKLDSLNIDYYSELAALYRRKFDYKSAIKYFEKAIEINPDYFKTYYNLGKLYWDIKNYKKAEYYFNNCIEKNPSFDDAYFYLAKVYLKQKKVRKADNLIQKFLEEKPNSAEAWFRLGYVKLKQHNYKDATECFEKSLKYDPSLFKAHKNLGILYSYRLHDKIKAIYHYQQYINNITDEKEKEKIENKIKNLQK